MNRLLIDTNILLDVLMERDPFYAPAAKLFSQEHLGKQNLFVSALSIANINYILTSELKNKDIRQILREVRVMFTILPLNEKITDLALNDSTFNDFEDALQYFTAESFDLDTIITRNLKDFRKSSLPVMTASHYLGIKR